MLKKTTTIFAEDIMKPVLKIRDAEPEKLKIVLRLPIEKA